MQLDDWASTADHNALDHLDSAVSGSVACYTRTKAQISTMIKLAKPSQVPISHTSKLADMQLKFSEYAWYAREPTSEWAASANICASANKTNARHWKTFIAVRRAAQLIENTALKWFNARRVFCACSLVRHRRLFCCMHFKWRKHNGIDHSRR